MAKNLIENIKEAEGLASELIEKAEQNNNKKLKSIGDQYKIKLNELAEKFKLVKKDVAHKAMESFLMENSEKKIIKEKQIRLISKNAEKNRDKVTKFIIQKIIG